jgi:chromosome segregation ATPase
MSVDAETLSAISGMEQACATARARVEDLVAELDDLRRCLRSVITQRDEARALNSEWAEKAATWIASPEAAQRLDGYRDLGQQVAEAQRERDEARAEVERLKTFAAQNFSTMIRQEAEQMREYGLSYEGVRKVLHEYNDGEISFGKLMDLIRAAARAMAEDKP